MRGAPHGGRPVGLADGIIPAHAGSTPAGAGSARRPWDHPRACGEHVYLAGLMRQLEGSSPRMRGAHDVVRYDGLLAGIIPAHAGSTLEAPQALPASWDHPRACGEHLWLPWSSSPRLGSSPRMRGAPMYDVARERLNGIIPAHAGSTASLLTRTTTYRDHPRACGEHSPDGATKTMRKGSSPRMRGARESKSRRI